MLVARGAWRVARGYGARSLSHLAPRSVEKLPWSRVNDRIVLLADWLDAVADASPASQERFARVERMLLRMVVASDQSPFEKSMAARLKNMTRSEPCV